MLRTFGCVMPILLPLTSVLIVVTAVLAPSGAPRMLWVVAAAAAAVLIAFTLIINVPINKRTLTWDPEPPPRTGRTTAVGGTPTRGSAQSCSRSGSSAP
jgi:hypothetical protein